MRKSPYTITESPLYKVKKQLKHGESDLHLKFCKHIKKYHPELYFIRHEREKARSQFSGGLMSIYNSVDGICDFELIEPVSSYFGLYIEFKKPGESWQVKGKVKDKYAHQYEFHLKMWSKSKPAYFCNDFDMAVSILNDYLSGNPQQMQVLIRADEYLDLPMQKYSLPLDKNAEKADEFFNSYNAI